MAEESTKKRGRLAAAVIAGSTLAFGSFAMAVPAALADENEKPPVTLATQEAEEDTAQPEPTEEVVTPPAGDNDTDDRDNTPAIDDGEDAEPVEEPAAETPSEPVTDEGNVPSEEPAQIESETAVQNDNLEVQQDSTGPEISLDRSVVLPGETVTVTGTGFSDGESEPAAIYLHSEGESYEGATLLETTQSNEDGAISAPVTIPENTEHGEYVITAHGENSGVTPTISLTVGAEDNIDLDPAIDLWPSEGQVGDEITFQGEGFYPGSSVEVSMSLFGEELEFDLGTFNVDGTGALIDPEFIVPDDAVPGTYAFWVIDEANETNLQYSFTVINDDDGEVTEPTLTADRDQITLDDFGGAAEDEPGVHFTVEGLEAGTEINYAVEASGNLEDLDGSTSVSDDGVAGFFIHGFDSVSDPTVYLGDYSVTATYVDEAGETQELGPETFSVVEDGPLVELSASQAYPGEDITVSGHGFSANAELEISINPTLAELTADDNGAFSTEVTIPEDLAPGHYDITVDNQNADEWALQTIEILDPAVDPSLTITPERITLEKFVGEPEDGAGVAHVVEGLEPGAEITYLIASPEYVNDYESRATADENGVAQFVIHGYDVANPSVYLGEYRTVVTYIEEDGDTAALNGDFMVVDGDGSTGGSGDSDDSDDAGSSSPADLNGYDGLAQTGATGMQFGFLAGGLLLLGAAFVAFANRARLFGRKN